MKELIIRMVSGALYTIELISALLERLQSVCPHQKRIAALQDPAYPMPEYAPNVPYTKTFCPDCFKEENVTNEQLAKGPPVEYVERLQFNAVIEQAHKELGINDDPIT